MRLQLTVYRHTLPPTRILFSTAPHPSAHTSARDATVSDLLHDLNDLVPLESDDGVWGLEDYIVEVAATADQDHVYEALHFQNLDSVLREDDEVIVRYLKSDELKGRRWGGRMQITAEGTHLTDGVVWGRRFDRAARAGTRPGIGIPPRKKRGSIEVETGRDIVAGDSLLAITGDDDQEDNDSVEDEALDEVKVTDMFIDADEDGDDDVVEEMDGDEVQLLLKDAEEVENSSSPLPEALLERQLHKRLASGRSGPRKRKRAIEDEGEEDSDFEGLSTLGKSQTPRRVQFEDQQLDEGGEDESSQSDSDSENESMADESSSSGTSDSESDDSETSDSSQDSVSSSNTSSLSDSDSDSETQKRKSAGTATADHASLVSKSTLTHVQQVAQQPQVAPGQGSAATHKKNERNKRVKTLKRLKNEGILPPNANLTDLRAYQNGNDPAEAQPNTPEKELEAARLRALENVQALDSGAMDLGPGDNIKSPPPAANAELPESVEPKDTTNSSPQSANGTSAKRSRIDVAASRRMLFGSLGLRNPKTAAEEQALRKKLARTARQKLPERQAERNTSPLAERPDSPDADDSWEHKLTVSAVECDKQGVKMTAPPFPFEQYWMKRKLILKPSDPEDIELDYDDAESSKAIPQPDMRFQDVPNTDQRLKLKELSGRLPAFLVRECYEALRMSNWIYDDAVEHLFETEASQQGRDIAIQKSPQKSLRPEDISESASRTVSFAKDDVDGMPIPTNIETLVDLEEAHLLAGAIIAYKELHLGEETNFQPGISSYRVARVTDVDGNYVMVVLAAKDRKKPAARDAETGEVIANSFEVRTSHGDDDDDDDDAVDDGVREIEFTQMISPKLVEAGVQVPHSSSNHSLRGGDIARDSHHQSSEAVPDSAPTASNKSTHPTSDSKDEQLEIDTPRRKEIATLVKDAGFDSAMDAQLLEALSSKATDLSSDAFQSQGDASGEHSVIEEDLAEPEIAATGQTQTTGRSSSQLLPPNRSTVPEEIDEANGSIIDDPPLTSSPPVSPQLTVDYPHISQMDLEPSFHAPNESSKNSSSHQDAQRVPAITPADTTITFAAAEDLDSISPNDDDASYHEDPIEEQPSEVPQSQSQEASNLQPLSEPNEDNAPTPPTSSFLGSRGVNGPASSPNPHDSHREVEVEDGENDRDDDIQSDSEYDSDDSLPSLAELTSSQRRKIGPKKLPSKRTLSSDKRVSPPPISRSSRNVRSSSSEMNRKGIKIASKIATPPFSFDGADDFLLPDEREPESSLDPLQALIKTSSSQKEKRMSQVPVGTQVVDLTLACDLMGPSDSDGEFGGFTRRSSSWVKARSSKNGGRKAKGKGSKLGASVSDLGAVGGTGGVGTKRYLTAKKSRSQI